MFKTYEERLAAVKEAEHCLRIAQIDYTKALWSGDWDAMKAARRECLIYRRAVIGIAEPFLANGDKVSKPVDKRLYKL